MPVELEKRTVTGVDSRCSVRRPCEGSGVGRRRKRTRQHSAFGMGWSKARVQSEDSVELLKQILTQRN